MSGPIRIFEGRFGRVSLEVAAASAAAVEGAAVLLKHDGADGECAVRGERLPFTREDLLLVNPGESLQLLPGTGIAPARLLAVRPACEWLGERFPALRESGGRLFPRPHETVTARIRRLADTLAIEVLNDQFLAGERIEFMLQELMLSIVETYLARRRARSPLWRGSRFSDRRIRRAIALLRANPNKNVNMDELASEVGLSRSRFYDLFQICTGHSPRAYLDMLCVEAAIARLAGGGGRIADVSAELGFSAQSNFTRFFLNQIGIPPSRYRRATTKRDDERSG
jgi:AraC-like DNA-binding protein